MSIGIVGFKTAALCSRSARHSPNPSWRERDCRKPFGNAGLRSRPCRLSVANGGSQRSTFQLVDGKSELNRCNFQLADGKDRLKGDNFQLVDRNGELPSANGTSSVANVNWKACNGAGNVGAGKDQVGNIKCIPATINGVQYHTSWAHGPFPCRHMTKKPRIFLISEVFCLSIACINASYA